MILIISYFVRVFPFVFILLWLTLRVYVPYDNSVMEPFVSNMKREELYRRKYRSEREIHKAITGYVIFYNDKRPHISNRYKTPTAKMCPKTVVSDCKDFYFYFSVWLFSKLLFQCLILKSSKSEVKSRRTSSKIS